MVELTVVNRVLGKRSQVALAVQFHSLVGGGALARGSHLSSLPEIRLIGRVSGIDHLRRSEALGVVRSLNGVELLALTVLRVIRDLDAFQEILIQVLISTARLLLLVIIIVRNLASLSWRALLQGPIIGILIWRLLGSGSTSKISTNNVLISRWINNLRKISLSSDFCALS